MVMKLNNEGETIGEGMNSTNPKDVNSPFVLMPRKDPVAFHAMRAYADMCEAPLGNAIRAWLRLIAQAEPIYGTQGRKNRAAIQLRLLAEEPG